MKIDPEKLKEYVKRINAGPCALCGHNQWTMSDRIFQALEFEEKGLVLGGQAVPIVPLTCTYCGNTYFINAIVAGFVKPNPPDDRAIDDAGSEE